MRNRRRLISTGSEKSISTQLLSLSLFIMLLAFFIVLNAISSFQASKVKPVLNSLGYAFASRALDVEVDEQPSVTTSEERASGEGSTVERIKALFSSQIPSHKAVVSNRKGVMHVTLPLDDFEAAVMAVGQGSFGDNQSESGKLLKTFFLPTLVALVRTDQATQPYRMDMLLNVAGNPANLQNVQPKEMAALVSRLSRIAGRLESAGLPPRLVSIGLQSGEAGTIELFFRRHVPVNPAGVADAAQKE